MDTLEEIVDSIEKRSFPEHQSHPDILFRLASTASLIQSGVVDFPINIESEYIDAVLVTLHTDEDSLSRRFANTTGENLNAFLIIPFALAEPCNFSTLVPHLWELWNERDQYYELVHAAIALTFPKSDILLQLPKANHDHLCRLAQTEVIWRCDMNFPYLMEIRGLPQSQEAFGEWVAGTAPT